MSAVNPVTASLLSRLHTQQPITSDESYALAMLLGRVDHARRYVETRGTEHPIEAVLLREILDDFLGEPLLSGAAPSSTEDTPPQPRVWQKGDPEPEGIDLVHDAGDPRGSTPFARRNPDGRWCWVRRPDEPTKAWYGLPWEELLADAFGPLSEVPASPGPTGGQG